MGIDGMRVGGGRCPPLIVAGLLVACFLLVCNWWSLSTENTELLRQIDGLSQQLKSSVEEGDQCGTRRRKLADDYKRAEEDIRTLHVQLGQEKDKITGKDEAVSMCNSELDSQKKLDVTKTATIEALRLKEETTNRQLLQKKEENERLQDELGKVQDELNRLKLSRETVVAKNLPAPKPPAADTVLTNETQTGGDRDLQNVLDAGDNRGQSNEIEAADIPENPEDDDGPQDSLRDQIMNLATAPEFKPVAQEEN